jgi:hypothetical protein
LHLIRLFLVVG